MTETVGRVVDVVTGRASQASVSFFLYCCSSLVAIASVLLLITGFRVVVLNEGFRLSNGVDGILLSFRNDRSPNDEAKLKALVDSIVEFKGARICFRRPGWKAMDCLEEANVTGRFDDPGNGTGVRELAAVK